jgi:predicted PurR-regulated permease PerM
VAVVAALWFARDVLVPVALAGLASFVLSPLVARLERWHWRRAPAVLATTLLSFALIVLVGSVVIGQATDLAEDLPQYRAHLVEKLAALRSKFGAPLQRASAEVQRIGNELGERKADEPPIGPDGALTPSRRDDHVGAPATTPPNAPADASAPPAAATTVVLSTGDRLAAAVRPVLSFLLTAAVVTLLTILMLLQREDLRDRVLALVGGSHVVLATRTLEDAASRVSRYLLLLTLLNGVYGTVVGLALAWIGVPNSLLWGLLWAVLRFVPYVGPWVGAAVPVAFALVRFDSSTPALLAAGLYVVLEVVNLEVVEPLVFPSQVGVSRIALVVSVLFWTWVWGVPGLVLATPLTVCLAAVGKHVPRLGFLDVVLGDSPALPLSSRLGRRLLASEGDAGRELVHAELEQGRDLVEVYDSIVLPAVVQAQKNRRDGTIDEPTLLRVAHHFRELVDEANDRAPTSKEPGAAASRDSAPATSVLFVPTHHELDDVACTMAAQVARRAGFEVQEVESGATADDVLKRLAVGRVDVVCLSQVPPVSFTRLRHLCRRVTARFPRQRIVVATWTVPLDAGRLRERMHGDRRLGFTTALRGLEGALREAAREAARERVSETARVSAAPRGVS